MTFYVFSLSLSLSVSVAACVSPPMLKNVEDDHLNDSLGNPGLISPDKEDLSRLLVRKKILILKIHSLLRSSSDQRSFK